MRSAATTIESVRATTAGAWARRARHRAGRAAGRRGRPSGGRPGRSDRRRRRGEIEEGRVEGLVEGDGGHAHPTVGLTVEAVLHPVQDTALHVEAELHLVGTEEHLGPGARPPAAAGRHSQYLAPERRSARLTSMATGAADAGGTRGGPGRRWAHLGLLADPHRPSSGWRHSSTPVADQLNRVRCGPPKSERHGTGARTQASTSGPRPPARGSPGTTGRPRAGLRRNASRLRSGSVHWSPSARNVRQRRSLSWRSSSTAAGRPPSANVTPRPPSARGPLPPVPGSPHRRR